MSEVRGQISEVSGRFYSCCGSGKERILLTIEEQYAPD